MEDRIWNGLSNIKFRSIYTEKVSRRIHYIENGYSFFLSFASASSVAAWAIWAAVPYIWASIVTVSQVLHIAKPYLPFSKGARDFIEMSLLYESVYLEYEKLWYENRKANRDVGKLENRYNDLRQKKHAIDKCFKHIFRPELKGLVTKADVETDEFLTNNF